MSVGSSSSARWSNDASLSDCTSALPLLCMQTDYAVRVAPQPPAPGTVKWAFILEVGDDTFSGGLATLDMACDSAGDLHDPGTYRALVAMSSASASSRFTPAGLPYARPDGVIVAATEANLLAAAPSLLAPINTALPGPEYEPSAVVFTGAVNPTALALDNCSDWSASGDPATAYAGISGDTGVSFFGNASYFCPTTTGESRSSRTRRRIRLGRRRRLQQRFRRVRFDGWHGSAGGIRRRRCVHGSGRRSRGPE
jgi:hypothetical protein